MLCDVDVQARLGSLGELVGDVAPADPVAVQGGEGAITVNPALLCYISVGNI